MLNHHNFKYQGPAGTLYATSPFGLVPLDFTKLENDKGYQYLLVITDVFTKFAVAMATKDKKKNRQLLHVFLLINGYFILGLLQNYI